MAFSLASILPLPDMLALGWFFLCWVGYAWYADHRRWGTRELASVLHEYRLRWMRRVLERENPIADTVVLQTLMLFAPAPMPAEKDAPDRADFAPASTPRQ